MDVRASDTSNLAAKQLELENVQPVKERRGFMQDRVPTHKAAEADGNITKPKPAKNSRDEHDGPYPDEGLLAEQGAIPEEEGSDTPASPATGEQHILDVKV